jgi:hypothetical protein
MANILDEKFKVTAEDGILHVSVFKMIEDQSQIQAAIEYAQKSVADILNKDSGKIFNVLVEILAKDESTKMPKDVVDMFKSFAQHPQIDKIAIYTQDFFMRMITNTVCYLTGKDTKIRCFDQKVQAAEWLKEKN